MSTDTIAILESLSRGMDPVTNKPLPESDSCCKIQVVRALFEALSTLKEKNNINVKPAKSSKRTLSIKAPVQLGGTTIEFLTECDSDGEFFLIKTDLSVKDIINVKKFNSKYVMGKGYIIPNDMMSALKEDLTSKGAVVEVKQFTEKNKISSRSGSKWTPEECVNLCELFDKKLTLSEIALQHKRTLNSVEMQLVKEGKIPYDEERHGKYKTLKEKFDN